MAFVDYQKAFDRVNHEKLVEVMKKAGILELEQRLIINLYWNQYATVRTREGKSRRICIRRGVRQGCIISPILFNLYSEYMMKEAIEEARGITINGKNLNNLRHADDAVLINEMENQLQMMLDKVNETCKEYKMDINVKKTKVMVISKMNDGKCECSINGVKLEQVTHYKYLGSIITEDGRYVKEIKARIAMAKAAFWKHKELLRGNLRLETKKRILQCYVFPVVK